MEGLKSGGANSCNARPFKVLFLFLQKLVGPGANQNFNPILSGFDIKTSVLIIQIRA